jgi:hypothetical protein
VLAALKQTFAHRLLPELRGKTDAASAIGPTKNVAQFW